MASRGISWHLILSQSPLVDLEEQIEEITRQTLVKSLRPCKKACCDVCSSVDGKRLQNVSHSVCQCLGFLTPRLPSPWHALKPYQVGLEVGNTDGYGHGSEGGKRRHVMEIG